MLRIRDGKGGKDALLPIAPDCAEVLKQYLEIRQKVVLVDGSELFSPQIFITGGIVGISIACLWTIRKRQE
jgi:site-specific recombinase XerD